MLEDEHLDAVGGREDSRQRRGPFHGTIGIYQEMAELVAGEPWEEGENEWRVSGWMAAGGVADWCVDETVRSGLLPVRPSWLLQSGVRVP